MTDTPSLPALNTLSDLVYRAKHGDAEAAELLRARWRENPAILDDIGAGSAAALIGWVKRCSLGKPLEEEILCAKIVYMRRELLGPSPSPLESLLVDNILTCWLAVQDADSRLAVSRPDKVTMVQERFTIDRATSAHRRYLATVKTLAQIRRLQLPVVLAQLNIGGQQLNIATTSPPTEE